MEIELIAESTRDDRKTSTAVQSCLNLHCSQTVDVIG